MKIDNQKEKKRYLAMPKWLLVIGLVFLFCYIFDISFYWLITFQNLFNDASLFLNVAILLHFFYLIHNRKELEKIYDGLLICMLDFVLINKFYSNQKLNSIFTKIKDFYSNYRIGTNLLFIAIVIVCVLFVLRWLIRKEHKLSGSIYNSNYTDIAPNTGKNPKDVPPEKSTIKTKKPQFLSNTPSEDEREKAYYIWLFLGIFIFFSIIITVFLFLIVKENFFTKINKMYGLDMLERVVIIGLSIIFLVALIILIIAMLATVCKYICDILFRVKEKKFRELFIKLTSDKTIKMAVTIVLTLVIYILGTKNTFTESDLLNWLSTGNIVPLLIALLISFVIAAIVVNIATSLFGGEKIEKIKKIASETIDHVIEICEDLIKQVFRVIKACGPNFIDSLCSLLFDEEEDD